MVSIIQNTSVIFFGGACGSLRATNGLELLSLDTLALQDVLRLDGVPPNLLV